MIIFDLDKTLVNGDKPVKAAIGIFEYIRKSKEYASDMPWVDYDGMQIWSSRCESVREKTEKWLCKYIFNYSDRVILKMRPIGDTAAIDELKERWLDEYISSMYPNLPFPNEENNGKVFYRKEPIEFVFDNCPKSIKMWRRRGVVVFNCEYSEKL